MDWYAQLCDLSLGYQIEFVGGDVSREPISIHCADDARALSCSSGLLPSPGMRQCQSGGSGGGGSGGDCGCAAIPPSACVGLRQSTVKRSLAIAAACAARPATPPDPLEPSVRATCGATGSFTSPGMRQWHSGGGGGDCRRGYFAASVATPVLVLSVEPSSIALTYGGGRVGMLPATGHSASGGRALGGMLTAHPGDLTPAAFPGSGTARCLFRHMPSDRWRVERLARVLAAPRRATGVPAALPGFGTARCL
jgi:hypothetical protein